MLLTYDLLSTCGDATEDDEDKTDVIYGLLMTDSLDIVVLRFKITFPYLEGRKYLEIFIVSNR